jgi:hypothetical protein
MDKEYNSNNSMTPDDLAQRSPGNEQDMMSPIEHLGMSVTEGQRFGTFRQSIKAALHLGARKVELQTQMGGGAEPVGAESYGKAAREELREISRANELEISAVHAPSNIGNLSGYVPRQGGPGEFSDEQRLVSLEEIKKAVNFSADVAGGGAVVVHTGEWQRPISEQPWALERNADGSPKVDEKGNNIYRFLSYQEEPGRGVTFMVDDRTGRVLSDVRKSQTVREPLFIEAGDAPDPITGVDFSQSVGKWDAKRSRVLGDGHIKKGDLLNKEGEWLDPDEPDDLFWRIPKYDESGTRFLSRELNWGDFEKRSKEWNERNKKFIAQGLTHEHRAEDEFFKTQLETQILQYRGSGLFYGRFYEQEKKSLDELKKAKQFYDKLESEMDPEDKWKIAVEKYPRIRSSEVARLITPQTSDPSEVLADAIKEQELELKYIRESSAAADSQADTQLDTLRHIVPVDVYAKKQSMKSYAEAGIHAMQQSDTNPHVNRPIFVAPENIFPEFGYGSHPEELRDLVKDARENMINFLTKKEIEDPYGRLYTEDEAARLGVNKFSSEHGKEEAEKLGKRFFTGKIKTIQNPYYHKDMSKEQASKEANEHIRATFDTQHLGMWRKHFQGIWLKSEGRFENKQETDARFKEWYLDQVKMLHEEDVVGHIHYVDAMGAGHHHLPAGQGDLPVIDAVKYFRDRGYTSSITSEGFGEEQISQGRILTESWKSLGSSVYGTEGMHLGGGGAGGGRWENIHQSYFGQNKPPYYVFGSYAPSNDWTLWSQTPME